MLLFTTVSIIAYVHGDGGNLAAKQIGCGLRSAVSYLKLCKPVNKVRTAPLVYLLVPGNAPIPRSNLKLILTFTLLIIIFLLSLSLSIYLSIYPSIYLSPSLILTFILFIIIFLLPLSSLSIYISICHPHFYTFNSLLLFLFLLHVIFFLCC